MWAISLEIQGHKIGFQFGIYDGEDGISFDPAEFHPGLPEFVEVMTIAAERWISFEAVCRMTEYADQYTDRLDYHSPEQMAKMLTDIEVVINQKHWTFDLDKIILFRASVRRELARRETRERQEAQKKAKAEKLDKGYVYLIQSPTGAYKIGRTKHPEQRMKTFGVQLPFEVEFLCMIETTKMRLLERELHEKFESKRVNGEWFALEPSDVDYIKGLSNG
jgi:hypothetical protein